MKIIIGLILIGGFIAFATTQIIAIVRTLKERKKVKSMLKEGNNE